MYTAA